MNDPNEDGWGPGADGWSMWISAGGDSLPKPSRGNRMGLHQDRGVQKKDEWIQGGFGVGLGLSTCKDEKMDEGPLLMDVWCHTLMSSPKSSWVSGQWMSSGPPGPSVTMGVTVYTDERGVYMDEIYYIDENFRQPVDAALALKGRGTLQRRKMGGSLPSYNNNLLKWKWTQKGVAPLLIIWDFQTSKLHWKST